MRSQWLFAGLLAVGALLMAPDVAGADPGSPSARPPRALRSVARRLAGRSHRQARGRASERDRRAAATPLPPGDGTSRSIGRANRGRLEHGVELVESANVRYKAPSTEGRWGTAEMVGSLERAAAHVAATLPGARLTLGDIARPRGGRITPHRSHRNGRDVDVGFYYVDDAGTPVVEDRFVTVLRDGTAHDRGRVMRFDDARNWELIASLVSDAEAPVQYIFVSNVVRARLLAAAAERGAPADVVERAATVMMQPRRGSPHRDHFHVRVYCAPTDRPACVDEPPYYAWYPGVPANGRIALAPSASERRVR